MRTMTIITALAIALAPSLALAQEQPETLEGRPSSASPPESELILERIEKLEKENAELKRKHELLAAKLMRQNQRVRPPARPVDDVELEARRELAQLQFFGLLASGLVVGGLLSVEAQDATPLAVGMGGSFLPAAIVALGHVEEMRGVQVAGYALEVAVVIATFMVARQVAVRPL